MKNTGFSNDPSVLKMQLKMGVFSGKLRKDALALLRKIRKEEKK